MPDFEITIIGAGVVGLAIGERLSRTHPNILILEKNEKYGMETSSRNSEVIHAGIYYTPGSLKAVLCVEGKDELYAACKAHNIAHKRITKIITAASGEESPKLEGIYRNGIANGVPLELLDAAAVKKLEPNIRTFGGIFSPTTGIINAHELMDYFYHTAMNRGATVQQRCEVIGIDPGNAGYTLSLVEAGVRSTVTSEVVINAAGLWADRIATLVGIDVDKAGYRLTFAKGSYFAVRSSKAKLVSRLVYPVASSDTLGVHALFDLGGRLRFGPDLEYIPTHHFEYSVAEEKRNAFAESIRRILPSIEDDDISPDMSGIRPKLQRKGEPPKDFVIVHEKKRGLEGFINLIGIESPGLTASPAIARHVEGLLY